jgi:hypothetical protein
MIKELVYENKNVAFFCSTLEHFRELIVESKKEGIVFSKNGYIEEDFKRYEINLQEGYPHVILMVSNSYINHIELQLFKDEIQFYARSYKYYDTYNEWDKYKIVNYTELLRDIKLKETLNG